VTRLAVTQLAVTQLNGPTARISGPGHVYAADLVRVLTFVAVIAVHTVTTINPPERIPAGGAAMLLHFTREVFFALTAFVLVHRYRDGLRVVPFWRRRFLLVGVPYVIWSVIYSGLAGITVPLPPTAALTQLGTNLLTGTACYHLYFLVVSMQFFLLFPLFLRLLGGSVGHRCWHRWLLAISVVLQIGINAELHAAHPSRIAAELLRYDGSFVGSYVFYLVLGGVAALHAEEVQAWVRGHPAIVLVALVLTGAAAEAWLSTHMSALCSTVIVIATTIGVSLLVVEVLRHSPLSMVLTGKRRLLRGCAVHSSRFESSASALPIRLGAGRT
jgi:surface polysaccharide O-acyltransferase-like enzyme